ncbi:surface protease GP63, partial [Trypanosoma conorhini]
KTLRCTSNRQAIGQCDMNVAAGDAGEEEACSVFSIPSGAAPELLCTVEGSNPQPGSLNGGGSWCLDAEPLEARSKTTEDDYTKVHAVCAGVQCEAGKVKVKYVGGDAWQECPEGKFITPKSAHFKDGGKIKCPKYEEVCTIAANGSSLVKLSSADKDNKKADKDNKKADTDGKKGGHDGKKDDKDGKKDKDSKKADTESKKADTDSKKADTDSKKADTDSKKADTESKKTDTDSKKDGKKAKNGKKGGHDGSVAAAVLSSLLLLATVTAAAAVVPL